MIGIVAVALAAAFAVLAAEEKSDLNAAFARYWKAKSGTGQKLVRLKVDGKTVAELRVFDSSAFSLTGDQVNHVVETATTTAKGATLQFGGASGKSIIVKAEEIEVLPSNEAVNSGSAAASILTTSNAPPHIPIQFLTRLLY
jgi:hypothetical protein